MVYFLKIIYYIAFAYCIFSGLGVVLSFITPTHIINKKYWGFVISGVLGLILSVYSFVSDNHIIIIFAVVLPFILVRMFGGEPDLDPKKTIKVNL